LKEISASSHVKSGGELREAMTRNTRVTFSRCPKDLVDTTNEFGAGEGDDVIVCITVGRDGMLNVQFVFDKMFVNGVNRVQRGFLTWYPDVVTSRFLGFGPW
jgi:hypothetical protein